jgi:RimJ/RimL family protein N-acetyltransferase
VDVPNFSTTRLLVRPRTARDLPDLLRLHTNPRVMRYARFTEDWAAWDRKLCRSLVRPFPRGLGYWTVLDKGSNQQFIGSAMLIAFSENTRALEAGWRLEPGAWGHGYAQEALGVILEHGLSQTDVTRIVAFIHEDNLPSVRLASRLGFTATDVLSGSHRLFETCAAPPWFSRR